MRTRSADWSVSIARLGRNADGDIVARKYLAAEAMNRVNRGFIEREGSATNSVEIQTEIGRGIDTRLDHWITGFRLLEGSAASRKSSLKR